MVVTIADETLNLWGYKKSMLKVVSRKTSYEKIEILDPSLDRYFCHGRSYPAVPLLVPQMVGQVHCIQMRDFRL